METLPAPPPLLRSPASRRWAVYLKLAGILVLIGLLQAPIALTHGVLRERQAYQAQATQEVAGVWGRAQLVTGPVLGVPYAYRQPVIRSRVINGKATQVEEVELVGAIAYFLPEAMTVEGKVDPEIRHRGIYDTVVYSSRLKFTGYFQPDFAAAGIEADQIHGAKARVVIGPSDLRGVRAVSPVRWGGGEAAFEANGSAPGSVLPLAAKTPLTDSGRMEFVLELNLQGSERLEIAPLGKVTTVALESPWTAPSFTGSALPVARAVDGNGFRATWQSSHLSRGFPQAWTTRQTDNEGMLAKFSAASFGVKFVQPAAGYSMSERAQKYAVLFQVLVFAVFFLFETTAGLRIHFLQYLLVGGALCLFFLGFLALSEMVPTGAAYAIAAAACTLLVSLYAWSFLRTGGRSLVIAAGLGGIYGYLYFVLQSEDYALIAGTVALFTVLALTMFCTRRLNWYALDRSPAAPAAE